MNLLDFSIKKVEEKVDGIDYKKKFDELHDEIKKAIYENICSECKADCGDACVFLKFLLMFDSISFTRCQKCGGDALSLKRDGDELILCLSEKVLR